jgi:hypothetical protein
MHAVPRRTAPQPGNGIKAGTLKRPRMHTEAVDIVWPQSGFVKNCTKRAEQ